MSRRTENTKHVALITITDPDTKLPVEIEIRKTDSGIMVGIDGSFLEQDIGLVWSPYDKGVELIVSDDELGLPIRYNLHESI